MSNDNGAGKFTFEFDIGDLAILREALSTGSATAMAYFGEGKGADTRLRALEKMVDEFCPIPAGHGSEAYHWHDACAAVRKAHSYSVRVIKGDRWQREKRHQINVVVDGRTFVVARDVKPDESAAVAERCIEALTRVAGMDAVLSRSVSVDVPIEGREFGDEGRLKAVEATLNELLSKPLEWLTILKTGHCTENAADGRMMISTIIEAPAHAHEQMLRMIEEEAARPSANPAP